MMLGELKTRNREPKVYKYSEGHRKGAERMGKAIVEEYRTQYPEATEQALFLERAVKYYNDYFVALGAGELNKAQSIAKKYGRKMVY